LLTSCLSALQAQTYQPLTIVVADNASQDRSVELLRREFPQISLQTNDRNLGFGAAHNALFRTHDAPYVLVLNVDVKISPTYVQELVRILRDHPEVGMVQGKVLQWAEMSMKRIDNVGIRLHRNRRNDLIGYGEEDYGQYDEPMEVFGCDGAAVLYRRAMLEDIRQGDEYFDEAFFLFREDVDLAWRARWRGWHARYQPSAIAWHIRRYKPGSRRRQAAWLRRLQLRNRYFLLVKHESWRNLLRDAGPWAWFELRALAYATFVEPHYWLAFGGALRALPVLLRKRREIVVRRRVNANTMRQWYARAGPPMTGPVSPAMVNEEAGVLSGRITEHA